MFKRSHEQVATRPVSNAAIMRSAAFRHGVEDVRAGKAPRFDSYPDTRHHRAGGTAMVNAAWAYERGRQFAMIAPMSMPVFVRGRLNPEALRLFDEADIP
jgi:hypothetical protein